MSLSRFIFDWFNIHCDFVSDSLQRHHGFLTVRASARACSYPNYTRCSAIADRPRCRVRYSFRQKYRLELGNNILQTL